MTLPERSHPVAPDPHALIKRLRLADGANVDALLHEVLIYEVCNRLGIDAALEPKIGGSARTCSYAEGTRPISAISSCRVALSALFASSTVLEVTATPAKRRRKSPMPSVPRSRNTEIWRRRYYCSLSSMGAMAVTGTWRRHCTAQASMRSARRVGSHRNVMKTGIHMASSAHPESPRHGENSPQS